MLGVICIQWNAPILNIQFDESWQLSTPMKKVPFPSLQKVPFLPSTISLSFSPSKTITEVLLL